MPDKGDNSLLSLHLKYNHMALDSLKHTPEYKTCRVTEQCLTGIRHCPICRTSNATQRPHNNMTSREATRILEKIHCDTLGPFKGLSFFRSRDKKLSLIPQKYYITNIIDEFSKYVVSIISTTKSIGKVLFEELDMLNNKFSGVRIANFRADNAPELSDIQSFRDRGINREQVPSYSAELYGIAERIELCLTKLEDVF
ncbi:uncharacterized protein J8A68_005961 [[Candida] subhashii]|uniref:Uncharacterized protein n=1 Tax=[Candida] subhashii TaxID=561895 RepID=A0A8J5UGZ4_9ASCO|nr:uncharacterized protein J8A68_005961 [[Candida] subhashii]KAG7660542.1 hypothetical protein J8A68_005961 [[Candida] subhashii]